jgi:hypothetical protein
VGEGLVSGGGGRENCDSTSLRFGPEIASTAWFLHPHVPVDSQHSNN